MILKIKEYLGCHPTHDLRISDASTYDLRCRLYGETDMVPGGWGKLIYPCKKRK